MRKWSPTGRVFSIAFLAIAIWCLVSISRGDSGPLWIFEFLTLPMSLILVPLVQYIQSTFGVSEDVVGWSGSVLCVIWGMSMFYFFGWLLERPLRR